MLLMIFLLTVCFNTLHSQEKMCEINRGSLLYEHSVAVAKAWLFILHVVIFAATEKKIGVCI